MDSLKWRMATNIRGNSKILAILCLHCNPLTPGPDLTTFTFTVTKNAAETKRYTRLFLVYLIGADVG